MPRRSTTKNTTSTTPKPGPVATELQVTPEPSKIENIDTSAPANLEIETPKVEPTTAPVGAAAEKIQTDVREKLANRNVDRDIFVPSNPAALEKAADAVAQEKGFDLNRGTSIGARLLARAQLKKAQ